jgi:hypothetical protein
MIIQFPAGSAREITEVAVAPKSIPPPAKVWKRRH